VKPGPQTINAAGQITEPNVGGFIATEILPLLGVFRKKLSTLHANSMHEILEARLRPQRAEKVEFKLAKCLKEEAHPLLQLFTIICDGLTTCRKVAL